MSFDSSFSEIADAEATLMSLVINGRALHKEEREESKTIKSIREMQEANAQRSLMAAQRAMERLQWRPVTSIALVHTYVCRNCAGTMRLHAGFGVLMKRAVDQAERILMTECLDQAYPKEIHHTRSHNAACPSCLPALGFTYA